MSDCDVGWHMYYIIFLFMNGLFLISTVLIAYYYIKHGDKSKKQMFYIGLFFVIFSMVALMIFFISRFHAYTRCGKDQDALDILLTGPLSLFFYLSQSYLLVLVAYTRIHFVFKNTIFGLSKCTVYTFRAVFIILPLWFVAAPIIFRNDKDLRAYSMPFEILLFVGLVIAMMIIFIRKLLAVYRDSTHCQDHNLVRIITKITILNNISLSLTLLTPLLLIVVNFTNSMSWTVAFGFFPLSIDVYSNLICVAFAYSYFNNYYEKICGGLHAKCQVIWGKFAGRDAATLAAMSSDSENPTTGTTAGTECRTTKELSAQSQTQTGVTELTSNTSNTITEATVDFTASN